VSVGNLGDSRAVMGVYESGELRTVPLSTVRRKMCFFFEKTFLKFEECFDRITRRPTRRSGLGSRRSTQRRKAYAARPLPHKAGLRFAPRSHDHCAARMHVLPCHREPFAGNLCHTCAAFASPKRSESIVVRSGWQACGRRDDGARQGDLRLHALHRRLPDERPGGGGAVQLIPDGEGRAAAGDPPPRQHKARTFANHNPNRNPCSAASFRSAACRCLFSALKRLWILSRTRTKEPSASSCLLSALLLHVFSLPSVSSLNNPSS